MPSETDLKNWNYEKIELKIKYPYLTDSDLLWRDGGSKIDLLKEIAVRIGISWKELEQMLVEL